jgi:hypothetical protein
MPDLTGVPALDVAIGLAFLFFLLSTICAAVNELVAGWLGWRAQELEKSLRNLLGDEAQMHAFFAKPRITSLVDADRNAGHEKRRSPSYVPARTFALAVLDTFNPDLPKKADGQALPSRDAIEAARTMAEQLPAGPVRQAVVDALDNGRTSIHEIRKEVEAAFDEVMDRCSGWYKRRAQKFLLLYAAVLAVGLNIDTFHVATRLAKDDALRAAVVQRAAQATERPLTPGADIGTVAEKVDDVKRLGLPVGWAKVNQPSDFWSWVGRPFGWLATILALSLGAPFWFDVLGKFSRLRNSGNREGTEKTDRAPEDRDDPSGRRPAVASVET